MTRDRNSKVGSALFLIVGLIAIAIGLWQGWTRVQILQRATATTGHVVAGAGTPGRSSAHPFIEFRTKTGTVVRYRQNGMGALPVGTPVPLLYQLADPAGTAVARGFWQFWFPALAPLLLGCGLVGVLLLGVGVELRGGRY